MGYVDVAKQSTSDDILSNIGETDDVLDEEQTLHAKMNASLLKSAGLAVNINGVNAKLDGQTSPYGMATYGSVILTEDFVFPTMDTFNRYVVHVKSLTIPEGITMKPPEKCDGLYILSQGDVVINGNIDVRDMRKTFDSDIQMSPTINIGDTEYALAVGGYSPKGGDSGANGDIKYIPRLDESDSPTEDDWITYPSPGTVPTNSSAGNINGGGAGGYGVPPSRPYAWSSFGWDSDDDGYSSASIGLESIPAEPNTYDVAPTALVIIAEGDIIINGSIIASGSDGVSAEDGFAPVLRTQHVRQYSTYAGLGGKGAIPPSGGGPVTLICNALTNNGNIDTSGSSFTSADGADNTETSQQYYAIVNGGKGGKGGTFVSAPGEILVYETGGES